MIKISEYKMVDGEMRLVTRKMTAEEEAAFLDSAPSSLVSGESGTDALKEMITAMSTASTLVQMRNAAKEFLNKTGGGNSND